MVEGSGVKLTDIFWIFTEDSGRLSGAEPGFLSQEEKRRLAGLRFEKRRKDWLLGRWAAKSLLVRSGFHWAAGRMDEFQICNEESGAPFAADLAGNRLPGCLSISHRAGVAFCAYSPVHGACIGADLELIEPKNDVFFEDYLTPAEQDLVRSCSEEQRWLAIALIWSAKEAVFKAMGTGLRLDTRKVEIGLANSPLFKTIFPEWLPLLISGNVLPDKVACRWQVRNEFVLTFASLGDLDLNLIQVDK